MKATLIFLWAAAFSAHAALTFVSDKSTWATTDEVNWYQFGGPRYGMDVPSPSTFHSNGGITGSVTSTGGNMGRLDEGIGLHGSFAMLDRVLYTDNDGDLRFSFDTPVKGIGTQIQAMNFGIFTGTMEAFAEDGSSMGIFDFTGNSAALQDGSAPFIGIASDSADIYAVRIAAFHITGDILVNQLRLITEQEVTPVIPEPGTWLAGLLLLVPFIGKRCCRG